MKRLITVLLTSCMVLLMSWQTQAQVKLNPQIGVNVSALDAKIGDLKTEAKAGWNAGLDFRIGDGFIYLNPGAHFYSNTARLLNEADLEDPNIDMWRDETKIQSIKTPLNIGFNLTGGSKFLGIRAEGGIVPTYVLGVKETDTYTLKIEDLNRLTWGYNVGVGVDVLFLTADLSYEIGQANFFKDVEGKNNMLTLNLGIRF
ncbi:MAG: outer membrane beta-barrel protein [Saprospiraceae bacterium]|nr:outer membrane beta-barrel protein [Lewinella sp.]